MPGPKEGMLSESDERARAISEANGEETLEKTRRNLEGGKKIEKVGDVDIQATVEKRKEDLKKLGNKAFGGAKDLLGWVGKKIGSGFNFALGIDKHMINGAVFTAEAATAGYDFVSKKVEDAGKWAGEKATEAWENAVKKKNEIAGKVKNQIEIWRKGWETGKEKRGLKKDVRRERMAGAVNGLLEGAATWIQKLQEKSSKNYAEARGKSESRESRIKALEVELAELRGQRDGEATRTGELKSASATIEAAPAE